MIGLVRERTLHRHMGRHFHERAAAAAEVRQRDVRESAYQWYQAHEKEMLAETLSSMSQFVALCSAETECEIARYWQWLQTEGIDPDECFRRGLSEWNTGVAITDRLEALALAAGMLQKLGRWSSSLELQTTRITLAAGADMRPEEAWARTARGWILHAQGRYDDALRDLEHAATLFSELKDDKGLGHAIGNVGLVYFTRGEYDLAMGSFQRMRTIAEQLRDLRGLCDADGKIGLIHLDQNEYDKALECYRRKYDLAATIWDRRSMSWAVGNMGIAHLQSGNLDEALDSFRRHREISEELGDLLGVGYSIGNTGNVHLTREEFDQALHCYRQWYEIMESLGDRRGMSIAIGNSGLVHLRRCEYQPALECFGASHRLSSEIGELLGASRARGNMGYVFLDQCEYVQAVDAFLDAIRGYRNLDNIKGLADWLDGITRALVELAVDVRPTTADLEQLWPNASPTNWRDHSIREARRYVEQRVRIVASRGDAYDAFLPATLAAIDGDVVGAHRQFESLLAHAHDREQRAELHYWLWRTQGREKRIDAQGDRLEALRIYTMLYESAPKQLYRKRIDELRTAHEP